MGTNEGKQLKYFQLMEDLKAKILAGEIQAGDKLPSENELSAQYKISRQTVRKALSDVAECRIYICRTWARNILFGDDAACTAIKKHCRSDDVPVRLHFSSCYTGN